MKRGIILKSMICLAATCFLTMFLFSCAENKNSHSAEKEPKVMRYAKLPYDTPLDAVKWTSGYWHDYMKRLRDIYLPGIIDSSYLDIMNASSFRNLLRAAGMEKGGALGRPWSDGDCYLILDAAARLYAYKPDEYLKGKLDYWIPIIARVQQENGMVDTWSVLKDFDEGSPWRKYTGKFNPGELKGTVHYNIGHLCSAATSYKNATGDTSFLVIADKALNYSVAARVPVPGGMMWNAVFSGYSRTGDERYLNYLKRAYSGGSSAFGPPFREANEVFGHNTMTAHLLMGATVLYNFTNESALLEALKRLADNLLDSKVYITGALGPVFHGERPDITINGKTYPGTKTDMSEAIGTAFDLPNDDSYCESCGQCLYMEFFYNMFRLTGDPKYMDASERMLYNTTAGCVDLDKPNFFYCNPQEQLPGSRRSLTSGPDTRWDALYTWKRQNTSQCTCCPPKVLRAIAMTAEIAYNFTDDGLWVNLYGANTLNSELPWGGSIECRQTTKYPWDGHVELVVNKVNSKKPFNIYLRIPGWATTPVIIKLNGEVVEKAAKGCKFYTLSRKWRKGDKLEMDLEMPVRFMAADPRLKDNKGKVSVMRGPVVYCLEDEDIPEGLNVDSLYITEAARLIPVYTNELGGVTKLTGSLICKTSRTKPVDIAQVFKSDMGLYQEIKLTENVNISDKDRPVQISMIPFSTRLNRKGNYFRIWLPVYGITP
jgi:uncharacterized protein